MSKAEETLSQHIQLFGLPEPVREHRFHPTRRWRFDFAWPDLKLACEVEGVTRYGKNKNGSMKLGRHQSAKGIEGDLEKYQEAMLLGWDVYRCSQSMIKKGVAIDTLKTMMELKQCKAPKN